MKKFKFSLQNLLDLRSKKLEEKQIEFGKLQFVMKTLQTQLENLQNELVLSSKNLERLIDAGSHISVDLINSNRCYILKKEADIANQNQIIEEHKIKLDEKKNEMVEALKAKTMLEKLKEKQYKSFLKTLDDAERKELDEIGLMKYVR